VRWQPKSPYERFVNRECEALLSALVAWENLRGPERLPGGTLWRHFQVVNELRRYRHRRLR
jgi:hypothetical protein